MVMLRFLPKTIKCCFYTAAVLVVFNSCLSTSVNRSARFNNNDALDVGCQNIMQVAQYWLGVPYRYGGTDYSGVDCSGFVQFVYGKTFDIRLPRTTEEMFDAGYFVRNAAYNCGDLLFFKNVRGRGVDHVGIYIGNNKFIHASSSQGVTISNLEDDYYQEHFVAARRYF